MTVISGNWQRLADGMEISGGIAGFGLHDTPSLALPIERFGARASRLSAMAQLGLKVPPSLAIPIDVITKSGAFEGDLSVSLELALSRSIQAMQRTTGRWFGGKTDPLVLAVRASPIATISGLAPSFLHIGWTEAAIKQIEDDEKRTIANKAMARCIRCLAVTALGVRADVFDTPLDDAELDPDANWDEIRASISELALEKCGDAFPTNPIEQLHLALKSVWLSWNTPRAQTYRQMYDVEDSGGTPLLIQAMITAKEVEKGSIHIRSESTGEIETVCTTPDQQSSVEAQATQWEEHAAIAEELRYIIADNEIWFVDGEPLHLSTQAEIHFAVEMVKKGALDKTQALLRIAPERLIDVLHTTLDAKEPLKRIGEGLGVSPGAAAGIIVFSAARAEAIASKGRPIILVRQETSPEDVRAMSLASGVLTAKGGMTSHAAVIARGIGKPCIVSLRNVHLETKTRILKFGDMELTEGDEITIDGSTGYIYPTSLPLRPSDVSTNLNTLLQWADETRRMDIYANVESPREAALAKRFGAEGIGLCRSEHMVFEPTRLSAMRRMILADASENKDAALSELMPLLRSDFIKIFKIMQEYPVTIRLFDPPLHEFLPKKAEEIKTLAEAVGLSEQETRDRIDALDETNPMLGNRGCRLLISNPELTQMLVQIVIEAAIQVAQEDEVDITPNIMVPLVAMSREFVAICNVVHQTAKDVMHAHGFKIDYSVGSMIELPRAAMIADRIAPQAAFFSFGTNDLTQTVFGISRDDAVAFLKTYEKMGIMDKDPFVSLDIDGVGAVIKMATERGREAKPDLAIGICGEHGGDPSSIAFCESLNMDYVSCSPFRVPIARLAAARATLIHAMSVHL